MSATGRLRVLSVVHEDGETGGGGIFEERATTLGHEHTRWLPSAGPPPAGPEAYDAIMVFGGAVHPDQDEHHPWLAGEAAYIFAAIARGVPVLGVCLGSQLLARAAGGEVHPAAGVEIGWHTVELTRDGREDAVLGVLPARVEAFQWHFYAWRLPPSGVLLARSPAAPQAFRLGDRFWGVQFHPEVTPAMVERWSMEGQADLPLSLGETAAQTAALLPAWNTHGTALCEAFLGEAKRRARSR